MRGFVFLHGRYLHLPRISFLNIDVLCLICRAGSLRFSILESQIDLIGADFADYLLRK